VLQLFDLPFQTGNASIAPGTAGAGGNIRVGLAGVHAAGIICTAVKTLNNYEKCKTCNVKYKTEESPGNLFRGILVRVSIFHFTLHVLHFSFFPLRRRGSDNAPSPTV
jgi:hypothetical protein